MITRLRMSNFRRHRETELHFPDESQIILISGGNGAGKSSVLESITLALYGEGRHGKRNLDALVRWGAELEGFEVELDFTLEDTEYSIRRRRVNKLATAILYANGNPIVEGSNQVTAEVSKILGMDSSAFRLAVIAQQKELDGLASLRPAERAAQLSRLLRLDAISRAKDQARTIFRTERSVVQSLGGLDDIDMLRAEVTASQKLLSGAEDAYAEASRALLEVDTQLAATAAIDAAYSAALTRSARAEGGVGTARAEVERLSQELNRLQVPAAVPAPPESLESLTETANSIERRIAQGEAAKQVAAQRSMVETELRKLRTRIEEVRTLRGEDQLEAVRAQQEALATEFGALREQQTELAAALSTLREQVASVDTEAKLLARQKEATEELGAECDRCGQEIPEEHRHTQADRLAGELAQKQEQVAEITARGRSTKDELEKVQERVETTSARLTETARRAEELARLESELGELKRREDTYRAQLARLEVPEVDLDELYAQKGEVAVLVAQANEAARSIREREAALTRKLDLDLALSSAKERLSAAQAEHEAARMDADLERAYKERRALSERRNDEQALVAHWSTQVAVAREKLTAAETGRSRGEAALERRRGHEAKAQAAANSARVLSAVEDTLNSQIRPALEGSVSEVLGTLSEGRFSSVRVDQDYNITVEDDGAYRPLSELSGGEIDLVALSVRLALAGVVSDRHGGGVGFLILDECFGSQDPTRRESILAALRNLRNTYGQILLISHVGGLEDAADLVIEVEAVEDEEERISEARVA